MTLWTKIKAAFGVVPHSEVAKPTPIKRPPRGEKVSDIIARRAARKAS